MKTLHELIFPVTDIAAALDWYRGADDVSTVFADARRALITYENVALILICPDDSARRGSIALQGSALPARPAAVPVS